MGKLFPPVLRRAGVSVPVVVGVLLAMFLVLRFAQASGYEAWFSTDVGAVAAAGSSAYVESSDEFSLQGSGAGVGGVGDECFFTYLFLRGDGSITAKLLDVENTNADAIGAIAVREGTDPGSRQVVFGARPDGSLRLIVRTSSGASSTASSVSSGSFPQWLRLTRTGSSFAYYTSADGVSWTAHGSVAVSMDAVVRIGLVASSADDGNLCTAVFQGVATTGNTDDIDLDGLSDAWEWQYFGGLIHGPADDPDQDGLTNLQEFGLSAQPNNPDTDSDGMSDGWEAANGLDPSANDAASDGDGDGLTNLQEFVLGTHPLSSDTDADGVPDKWEVDHGTNPRTADAAEDPDGDGISNLLSYQLSSSVIAHLALDSGSGGRSSPIFPGNSLRRSCLSRRSSMPLSGARMPGIGRKMEFTPLWLVIACWPIAGCDMPWQAPKLEAGAPPGPTFARSEQGPEKGYSKRHGQAVTGGALWPLQKGKNTNH